MALWESIFIFVLPRCQNWKVQIPCPVLPPRQGPKDFVPAPLTFHSGVAFEGAEQQQEDTNHLIF